MKNNIIYGIVALLLGLAIGYVLPHSQRQEMVGAVSPIGSVQTAPQIYQFSFNASTTATTTNGGSIFSPVVITNNSNDREIMSVDASCNTVAAETQTALFQLQAATSSIATTSNTAFAFNLTIATTSANIFVSSSTAGVSGVGVKADNYIWPSGSNLIVATNATNTAVCTIRIPFVQL